MIIKCVFACTNASGSPDFGFVKVECTDSQYELGEHYEAAKDFALLNGYEAPFVIFDEHEAPDWLLERFAWDSASVYSAMPTEPASGRQLPEQVRLKAIKRLERDMADSLTEWSLRDKQELLEYVAEKEDYKSLSDEDLITMYAERFQELLEYVAEKEDYKSLSDEDLITMYAERFDELPPGIAEYTCSNCEQLVHYEKSGDKDVLVDRTGGDVCGVNGDNAPHVIDRTDDGYVL